MTVTVDLLNADGTLHTADLGASGQVSERGWVHPRARMGLGMGTITVPLDSGLYSSIAPHMLLRWNLDGSPVWLSVVAQTPHDRVAESHGQRQVIVDGPGGLALLGSSEVDGAVVEGFRDSGLLVFGWPSPAFDDSSWTPSVLLEKKGDGRPGDMWPDRDSGRIQLQAPDGSGDNPDQATWYHRRSVTVEADTEVRVFVWWDNLGTCWLDGEQVAKGRGVLSFERFDFVAEGTHKLAFSLYNKRKGDTPNPASLMYAGYAVNTDGELHRLLFRSEEGVGVWSDDPADVTLGYVWDRLLTDAQDRGALPGVTWTFDDTLDSDGVPWSTGLPMVSLRDGEPYWGALRQCLHLFGGVDAEMTPGLELKLWDDRVAASGVTLDDPGTVDAAVAGAQSSVEASGANTVRFETPDSFGWRVDTGRVTAEGRRETSASFGTAASEDEVTEALDQLAADLAGKVRQQIVTYGPAGRRPYTDYQVGQQVDATHDGTATAHTVESLSVTVDDDNDEVTFDVDVQADL